MPNSTALLTPSFRSDYITTGSYEFCGPRTHTRYYDVIQTPTAYSPLGPSQRRTTVYPLPYHTVVTTVTRREYGPSPLAPNAALRQPVVQTRTQTTTYQPSPLLHQATFNTPTALSPTTNPLALSAVLRQPVVQTRVLLTTRQPHTIYLEHRQNPLAPNAALRQPISRTIPYCSVITTGTRREYSPSPLAPNAALRQPVVQTTLMPQAVSNAPTIFSHAYWSSFEREVGSDSFYNLLRKLEMHHRHHPQEQIPRRLEALYQAIRHDPELRKAVFNEAQIGAESCSDLAATTLNQVETRCDIEQAIQGEEINDLSMLTIMRGLSRQEELRKIADRKVRQLEAEQSLLPNGQQIPLDPVETHLFYHTTLKEHLQLPGATRHMTFTDIAYVTKQEAQQAGNKIISLEKLDPKSLIDFIANNVHWQRYLLKHYQSQHDQDESIACFESRLEQLEEASERQEINGEEYRQRCNQLMQERETASKAWYLAKTHELIRRHLMS